MDNRIFMNAVEVIKHIRIQNLSGITLQAGEIYFWILKYGMEKFWISISRLSLIDIKPLDNLGTLEANVVP